MKVELKDLSETRKQLIVALEAAEVDQEFSRVSGEYARLARIPGFRPGHAPVAVIRKRFGKEIDQEAKQAVVAKAYRDGVKESGVDVLNVVDVSEAEVSAGNPVEIAITIEVHPKFDLPVYTGLEIKAGDTAVKPEEVEATIEGLRRERAEFKTIDRAAAEGDYVKFGFAGRVGEQKISELVPDRGMYGEMPSTWEEAGSEEGLLPGAGKHLVGMKAGDKKDADITFAESFAVPALAGKTATYSFSVEEVRERVMPEVDAAFLKLQGVESVEELRQQIEKSLAMRKQADDHAERRRQAADALAARVEFPIPDSLIEAETEGMLRQVIEQNIRRGVPQEELEKNKDELYAASRKAAIERTKVRMLLLRIAEAEKLKVDRDDINRALHREAARSNQRPEKIAKELEKDRDRVAALQQNILVDKALDFLVTKATVSSS